MNERKVTGLVDDDNDDEAEVETEDDSDEGILTVILLLFFSCSPKYFSILQAIINVRAIALC